MSYATLYRYYNCMCTIFSSQFGIEEFVVQPQNSIYIVSYMELMMFAAKKNVMKCLTPLNIFRCIFFDVVYTY